MAAEVDGLHGIDEKAGGRRWLRSIAVTLPMTVAAERAAMATSRAM
jgi:hypothetical protein